MVGTGPPLSCSGVSASSALWPSRVTASPVSVQRPEGSSIVIAFPEVKERSAGEAAEQSKAPLRPASTVSKVTGTPAETTTPPPRLSTIVEPRSVVGALAAIAPPFAPGPALRATVRFSSCASPPVIAIARPIPVAALLSESVLARSTAWPPSTAMPPPAAVAGATIAFSLTMMPSAESVPSERTPAPPPVPVVPSRTPPVTVSARTSRLPPGRTSKTRSLEPRTIVSDAAAPTIATGVVMSRSPVCAASSSGPYR